MLSLYRGQRLGITRALPLSRVIVPSTPQASLADAIGKLLGESVEIAIRIPHWKDTRSLVLRAFGSDGRTLAYAKLALDRHGEASVDAELRGLELAQQLGLQTVVAPKILHHGEWLGRSLLVTSPLVQALPSSTWTASPLSHMRELAGAGSCRQDALISSVWWSSACRRVNAVEDEHLRRRMEDCLECLQAYGSVEMPLGTAHGDWTPWNMAWDNERVLLWDWEHCATDVPTGFDPLHFAAQRLRVRLGTGPSAEYAWLREVDSLMDEWLGLDPAQRRGTVVAYLLDVNLRYILDRQLTSDCDVDRQGWGLRLLELESRKLQDDGR